MTKATFWMTRRVAAPNGASGIAVEAAPEKLSTPAAWVSDKLSLDQLLIGNRLTEHLGCAHIMTNAPRDLVDRYVSEQWYRHDVFGDLWRRRLGWTRPEEVVAWAEGDNRAHRQMQVRQQHGLPPQWAYSFVSAGAIGLITVARRAPLTPDEQRIIEFLGPSLFAGFIDIAGRRAADAITDRERQVLTLMSRGLTTGEIAQDLRLSEHTIVSHVRNAQSKLGTSNRAHTVAEALRIGAIGG